MQILTVQEICPWRDVRQNLFELQRFTSRNFQFCLVLGNQFSMLAEEADFTAQDTQGLGFAADVQIQLCSELFLSSSHIVTNHAIDLKRIKSFCQFSAIKGRKLSGLACCCGFLAKQVNSLDWPYFGACEVEGTTGLPDCTAQRQCSSEQYSFLIVVLIQCASQIESLVASGIVVIIAHSKTCPLASQNLNKAALQWISTEKQLHTVILPSVGDRSWYCLYAIYRYAAQMPVRQKQFLHCGRNWAVFGLARCMLRNSQNHHHGILAQNR